MPYVIVAIMFIIILLVVIYYYNTLVKKQNNIKNSFSSLDIELKKRYDLIPNLVETIKGITNHEENVLNKIAELRTKSLKAINNADVFSNNSKLENSINNLLLISESYPELQSSQNFLQLQKILKDVEDHISAARRTYNAHVNNYNTFIEKFPNMIFAQIFGCKREQLFEINSETRESRAWFHEN